MTDIVTIKDLREAIKTCCEVRAVIKFGVNDRWTKISKQTAFEIIDGVEGTPEDNEMYGSIFGELDVNNILYLG